MNEKYRIFYIATKANLKKLLSQCEFKGIREPPIEEKPKMSPKCVIENLHDLKIYCLKNKIKCWKYNYSLDIKVRNQNY